ncbi:hypothetical protein CWC15_00715 [Pseudoalteromonas spongiae]|nr:hypothetical protein CWC15_00715 [Pseudoalteromonas spongiae]
MIPNSRKLHNVPSDALIKEYEEKLLKHTIDHLKRDEIALVALMKKSGNGSKSSIREEQLKFLDELEDILDDRKFF